MNNNNDEQKNIVLTGFMGTGKTAVGLVLARKLNREFIDTDEIIQQRAGRSIPRIFKESGEKHFRQMEIELVKELSTKRNLVIATGGGTLLNNGNLQSLQKTGHIFCLTARPEILFNRLTGVKDRPLLGGNVSLERISDLLVRRKEKYIKIARQIDTSEIPIQRVAELIINFFKRITL
jgi:shikimate kinase